MTEYLSDNNLIKKSDLSDVSEQELNISPEVAIIDEVGDIIKESIKCLNDYAKCKAHEVTERQRINSCLRAINHQIDANKEVCLKYIESRFEERKKIYSMVEACITSAIKNNDNVMLENTYKFILNIYNGSPDISTITSQLFNNKNFIIGKLNG